MADDDYCRTQRIDEWFSPANEREQVLSILEEMWQRPFRRCGAGLISGIHVSNESYRSLEDRFLEQAQKWQMETGHLSSPTQRIMHPSYQAILGMGRDQRQEIIRLLIRDLQENRRAWFWALSYLAQDNPVSAEDAGKMDRMINAWVNWAKSKGIG
jgi:hypothetical protein